MTALFYQEFPLKTVFSEALPVLTMLFDKSMSQEVSGHNHLTNSILQHSPGLFSVSLPVCDTLKRLKFNWPS